MSAPAKLHHEKMQNLPLLATCVLQHVRWSVYREHRGQARARVCVWIDTGASANGWWMDRDDLAGLSAMLIEALVAESGR